MNLGFIVPGGFDPGGAEGTIPALVALTAELARRHRVHVLAAAGRSGPARYRFGEVEVTQLAPAARFRALRLGADVAGWLGSAGPFDVLHAFWADRTALLATAFARVLGVPTVVSIGGGELAWLADIPYGGAGAIRSRAVTRGALRLASAVTAGSPFVARMAPAWLAGRIEIVPLSVDTERFAAAPDRPSGPPWRLVHVANLNQVKDQATLLAALQRVVDRLGDVHLDCVGQDALNGAVQRRAHALGLDGHVTFHGLLGQNELAPFYRRAHLNVLSSRHESQGVVVLEAAAAGIPTVGTRVGSIDALAPDAARAVPIGDAPALAEAIVALLLDGAARQAMGAAAQRFARRHDVAWTARTFEAIYRRLAPVTRSGGTSAGPGRTS